MFYRVWPRVCQFSAYPGLRTQISVNHQREKLVFSLFCLQINSSLKVLLAVAADASSLEAANDLLSI
jgi:hypothetical protein